MAVFWDDVDEGTEVPPLVKHPTTRQLVQYAGASGDFYEIHYDKDFAQANELPGQIVHGALKNAFLAQLMTGWAGEDGTLKRVSCQYRGMDVPGDTLVCKGTVTRKYVQDGEHLVDCDIWLQNGEGERTTRGTATVRLPRRGD
jgi:acyl dehydratase